MSLKQKFAGMNKVVFLRELGLILAASIAIYYLIIFKGYSENIGMAFLLCSFCIAFSQRWKAHTSEHALSGKCIHSVDGYPEGTDLIEWNKKWTRGPKGGWNCSQPSLPGESYCSIHFSGSQFKITTVGNKGGKSMTLREERQQFLKEHSEIAKSMFGDRTELSEDEWYELAMATGNQPHPSDM